MSVKAIRSLILILNPASVNGRRFGTQNRKNANALKVWCLTTILTSVVVKEIRFGIKI